MNVSVPNYPIYPRCTVIRVRFVSPPALHLYFLPATDSINPDARRIFVIPCRTYSISLVCLILYRILRIQNEEVLYVEWYIANDNHISRADGLFSIFFQSRSQSSARGHSRYAFQARALCNQVSSLPGTKNKKNLNINIIILEHKISEQKHTCSNISRFCKRKGALCMDTIIFLWWHWMAWNSVFRFVYKIG